MSTQLLMSTHDEILYVEQAWTNHVDVLHACLCIAAIRQV